MPCGRELPPEARQNRDFFAPEGYRLGVALALLAALLFAPDVVFMDFEGTSYKGWQATGNAFGSAPSRGTEPTQMTVTGFLGRGLANSYQGTDAATGTLTSPTFTISHGYISFFIGGGKDLDRTCLRLLIDGSVVRRATGPNDRPGGSEALEPDGWNVQDLKGKQAQIQIVDEATGGWGHVNVDHIVFTDRIPPMPQTNVTRRLAVNDCFLLIPIKQGGPRRLVKFRFSGGMETANSISLADGEPDWWASMDLSKFQGQGLSVTVDRLRGDSKGLTSIKLAPSVANAYRESYRPQYHFSARSGWLNDPNGMVYFRGEYHMFFQHDPVGGGTDWKHWGHAVSKDMIHWRELPDALYPDDLGSMWSGGAVVDVRNTSGFGWPGKPAMVLFYTAAGNPSTQCMAYSTDGRNFTKYSGNPLLRQITPYNRDPRVVWFEPSKSWIMTLYVEHEGKHFIEFFSSPNLKEWRYESRTEGFFECPDFFEMRVEGQEKKRWILTAANSDYMVGTFDGHAFRSETPKLRGHYGTGYYAPQTFSDAPDGRRVQIGWMFTNPPDMPFTQSMSLPMEFKLFEANGQYELRRYPIRELDTLGRADPIPKTDLVPGAPNPLARLSGRAVALRLKAKLGPDGAFELDALGAQIRYDGKALTVEGQTLEVNASELEFEVFTDAVGLEVFVNGRYIPVPFVPKPGAKSFAFRVPSGSVTLFGTYRKLKSIW